jgi:hypothetical protein
MGPIKRQIMAFVLAACFAGAATRGMERTLSLSGAMFSLADNDALIARSAIAIQ